MKKYEFMDRETMKKDISKHVMEEYGIRIDQNSLSNLKLDTIIEMLRKILKKKLESLQIEDLYELIEDEKGTEKKYLRETIKRIVEIISDLDSYSLDLEADVFMGILRADKKYDIIIDGDKWKMPACNSNIDIKNAKAHYPYADKYDFLEKGIPGGCEEYHDLMMSQSNMAIFDIGEKTNSLQRYAFPKTYKIYKELEKTPVENTLFLEETQGVAFTNQVYYHVKDITAKEDLYELRWFVDTGLEIDPMFLRTKIIGELGKYLEYFSFSEKSKELVKEVLETIKYIVNTVYKAILEFGWYVGWLLYKKIGLKGIFLKLESSLVWGIPEYFDMESAYGDCAESMGIHNWYNINGVDNCFYYVDFDEGENKGKNEKWDKRLNTWMAHAEWINFSVKPTGEELKGFWIRKPLNLLGETIRDRAISELKKEWNLPENSRTLSELYYQKAEEVFVKLKEQEQQIWDNKDLKISTKKLSPLHVYAIVHREVIKKLNELE